MYIVIKTPNIFIALSLYMHMYRSIVEITHILIYKHKNLVLANFTEKQAVLICPSVGPSLYIRSVFTFIQRLCPETLFHSIS